MTVIESKKTIIIAAVRHLSTRIRAVHKNFTLLDRNSSPRGSVRVQEYGLVPVIGVLCALRRF